MPNDIPPPTHVLTLVFVAWAVGTIVFGAYSRQRYNEIGPGHFKVVWLTSAGLALAAGFGEHVMWIVAALCMLTFISIYRKLDRVASVVAAVASIAAIVHAEPIYALAPAALLGSVTNAMLLGHWHLNQPRLGTRPIAGLVRILWAALVVATGATIAVVLNTKGGIVVLAATTAVAFTIFSGVLTAMVQHLVKTRSIMSATGILYLEILLCAVAAFTGSLAALTPR